MTNQIDADQAEAARRLTGHAQTEWLGHYRDVVMERAKRAELEYLHTKALSTTPDVRSQSYTQNVVADVMTAFNTKGEPDDRD
jgi:hypothetical protein